MKRISGLLLVLAVVFLLGFSGCQDPADNNTPADQSTTSEGDVFDDGFESGETESWAEDSEAEAGAEAPTPEAQQESEADQAAAE